MSNITARQITDDVPPGMRRCTLCSCVLPKSEYNYNAGYAGRLHPYCKTCEKKRKERRKSQTDPNEIIEVAAETGRKFAGFFDPCDLYEAWDTGEYATLRDVADKFGLKPESAGRMLRASGRDTRMRTRS